MNIPVGGVGVNEALRWQPVDVIHVGIHVAQDKVFASQNVPAPANQPANITAAAADKEQAYPAFRFEASVKRVAEPGPPPLLQLRVGLMMPSDGAAGPEAGACGSTGLLEPWKGTLVKRRLAGVYSQGRLAASHLLHRGRSPEHLVLCEWHWLQALWALFLRVPASVWLCEGVVRETCCR